MNKNEKIEKVCKDFSMLSNIQQDYILGIMQALVFSSTESSQTKPEKNPAAEKIER